ncbi:MAG: DUF126 domain-containing protein [Clostridia bacterium]|nr:DUF126 domain-containing protein [Clostridia bacterium]
MPTIIKLQGKGRVKGVAEGEALVCRERISFWGGFNPFTGQIVEIGHPLHGQSVKGKVLVFISSKGSTAGSTVVSLAGLLGNVPAAMINSEIDDLAVQSCIACGLPLISDLDADPFEAIATGDYVRVDGEKGTVEVTKE